MKVGDLVKKKNTKHVGQVIDLIQKKCWRTNKLGPKINWGSIEPEPHAVILFGDNILTFPVCDVELI